ncbi:metallophosphoesterase [Bacillus suaedae]|uniref:Metallophosphoesterase family protein n=1 Tax=Halalkalibacter suaedae TaxID=2822140 RepID=A0A940WPZ5_9BACI|nr:metallophosphoesterase [Bacillus suaedae]MBP3950554.1 metallophosphoesterase family protein [Bacillus suaedae]
MVIFLSLLLVALLLVGYMWKEAFRDAVLSHNLFFTSIPKEFHNFQIYFISDVHKRNISKSLLNTVEGDVDLIVIGGDLCEKGVSYSRIENNVKQLTCLAPTYFIWGNNDVEVNSQKLQEIFKLHGVIELVNDIDTIRRGEESIHLIGTSFDLTRDEAKGLEQRIDETQFNILLCHDPQEKKHLLKKIPLILSGHTHGGQIRFLGFGLKEKGRLIKATNEYHLISNGYGTTLLPFRLGARAQTHLLRLLKQSV